MNKKLYWKTFYHGTNKDNAKIIKKNGFKRGTFFSTHLEDAVGYGGSYVFQVSIKLDYDHIYWEYVSRRKIPARQIVKLTIYSSKKLFYNQKLSDKIFKFNLKETLGIKAYRRNAALCGAIKRYGKKSI